MPIIHMPCMAHVIQLSLNKLLIKMEAAPRNDKEEIEWTKTEKEDRNKARQENQGIVFTLNKV
jgi:hypothetical protein